MAPKPVVLAPPAPNLCFVLQIHQLRLSVARSLCSALKARRRRGSETSGGRSGSTETFVLPSNPPVAAQNLYFGPQIQLPPTGNPWLQPN